MNLCENWAVAVVYLLENSAGYLDDITEYIKKKDVSKLGGGTSDKTVRNILKKSVDGEKVFHQEDPRNDPNYYSLCDEDEIKNHPEVKLVLEKLEWKEKIGTLKEHIGLIEQQISYIKQVCDETL